MEKSTTNLSLQSEVFQQKIAVIDKKIAFSKKLLVIVSTLMLALYIFK